MKQFFVFLILCCLIGPLSHALSFEGQVIDAKTGIGVPGIVVTVQDSGGRSPAVAAKTNYLGQYSIPWPTAATIGGTFRVWVGPACGAVQTVMTSYTGATPLITNFNVCAGAVNYLLQGRVKLRGNNNMPVNMQLISVGVDPAGRDTVARIVDSFQTSVNSNGLFQRKYGFIPQGRLLLKASLEPGHLNYGAYLPTYFSTSPSWNTATSLTNYAFIGDTTTITMVDTVRPTGSGCISGAARSAGTPLPDRIIILLNGSNVAVGFTYTNASGEFSFNNLAFGTYKIYGDVVPKLNPTLTLTLTSTKPCISNLVFEETPEMFSARLEMLGIGGSNGSLLEALQPLPNPVQEQVSLPGTEKIQGPKQLSVLDISGRIIAIQQFQAGETLSINTAAWPSGTYFLQLRTTAGTQNFRVSRL